MKLIKVLCVADAAKASGWVDLLVAIIEALLGR